MTFLGQSRNDLPSVSLSVEYGAHFVETCVVVSIVELGCVPTCAECIPFNSSGNTSSHQKLIDSAEGLGREDIRSRTRRIVSEDQIL